MCGRLNVIDSPQVQELCQQLQIEFSTVTNTDLRPTQAVDVLTGNAQLQTRWGIQPAWSERLLINAQAEKVNHSRLWQMAFKQQRCLVPCHGWYEWRTEQDGRKHKYLFSVSDRKPLFMAGLYWPAHVYAETATLVTLTTSANNYFAQYHHRMPVIIPFAQADWWLNGRAEGLAPLLMPQAQNAVSAMPA